MSLFKTRLFDILRFVGPVKSVHQQHRRQVSSLSGNGRRRGGDDSLQISPADRSAAGWYPE